MSDIAFFAAARDGKLDVLIELKNTATPKEWKAMIAAEDYSSLRFAARRAQASYFEQ